MLLTNVLLTVAVNLLWPAVPLAMPVKPAVKTVWFYWLCSESNE